MALCCLPPPASPTHPVGKAGTRSDSPRNAASACALPKQHGRHSDAVRLKKRQPYCWRSVNRAVDVTLTVRLTERYSCCTGMLPVLYRNGTRACAVLTLIFLWFFRAMKSLIFCRAKLSPLEAHEFRLDYPATTPARSLRPHRRKSQARCHKTHRFWCTCTKLTIQLI